MQSPGHDTNSCLLTHTNFFPSLAPPSFSPCPSLLSRKKNKLKPPRLTINNLDFTNREHLVILNEMGIIVEALSGGRIQVSHVMQKVSDFTMGFYICIIEILIFR